MTTSATAAAAAKVAKPKKAKTVSHAKPQEQTALPLPTTDKSPEFGNLALDKIIVRDQVRTEFDEDSLRELAADIADRGILQPLTVRKTADGFVLVAGERRLRAAKLAQLESVPVLISTMSEDEHHAAQLAENIQREELTTFETAKAIRSLYDLGNSLTEISDMVHKSKSWVSKRLAASHPNLAWQATQLLEKGITEDLELVLAVDQLAKLDYYEAQLIAQQVAQGKAGRETVRQKLTDVREKEAARAKQREAIEAERNDPEYQAKQKADRDAADARWKVAQEQQRQQMHIDPKRLMDQFWDWCGDNQEEGGSAWMATLDGEQAGSLTRELDLWYAAGTGMTPVTLVERLTREYIHADASYDGGTPIWAIAMLTFRATSTMKPIDLNGAFLDWYAGNYIRPEQRELANDK